MLASPLAPIASIAMVEEPRGGMRVTVRIDGPAKRGEVAAAARRAFAVLDAPVAAFAAHERVDRVTATSGTTSPRLLYGWIAPAEGDGSEAALRVAIVALAHNQAGRLARALVQRGIAAHLKGALDLGEAASVASLEIDAAVPRDAERSRALDAELDAAAASPPSASDLGAAKDILRSYLRGERGRPGRAGETKEAATARVDALLKKADDIAPEDVRAVIKKVFVPEHRVVVTITPRRPRRARPSSTVLRLAVAWHTLARSGSRSPLPGAASGISTRGTPVAWSAPHEASRSCLMALVVSIGGGAVIGCGSNDHAGSGSGGSGGGGGGACVVEESAPRRPSRT